MSKSEILFYNSLVSLLPALSFAAITGDLNKVSFNNNNIAP